MNDEIKKEKENNKIIILLENKMRRNIENMASNITPVKRFMSIIERKHPEKIVPEVISLSEKMDKDSFVEKSIDTSSKMESIGFGKNEETVENKLEELFNLIEKMRKEKKLCPECLNGS